MERAPRQFCQPVQVTCHELALCPFRRLQCDPVEHLAGLQTAADFVMVSADDDRTLETTDPLHGSIGIGTVSYDVSQDDDLMETFPFDSL
jgi:hypothetical protein